MKWLSLISGEPVPLSSCMSNISLSSFRRMTSFPPKRWDVRFTKDIRISNGLGEDAGEEFLHGMESYRKDLTQETGKADRAGICFRWILGTLGGDKRIKLIAQVFFPPDFGNFLMTT